MELPVPASKTDPFRKGITLIIAASTDAGCPINAMKRLQRVDSHRPLTAPLFCIGRYQHQAFTREHVVRSLQHLTITAGLSQGSWNGHSFRRGAATWAAEVRVSEAEIQILGRWRSDAYKHYIEYSNKEQISLSKRFQQKRNPHRAN